MNRDLLAVSGLHYTFFDARFRFGITAPTRHYFISSVYDIQKVMSQETSPAWRCIRVLGSFREGYVSAGCGTTEDTTGDRSFQLDETGHFRGSARSVLQALRGKVQMVTFGDVVIGDWIYGFADAVAAEIPDYFVEFEEVGSKRGICIDKAASKKRAAKKIEEAKLETGQLKSHLDALSGTQKTAARMVSKKTHTVARGENLIAIAIKYYQHASRWTDIYAANKTVIGPNPNLLRVGMQLELP